MRSSTLTLQVKWPKLGHNFAQESEPKGANPAIAPKKNDFSRLGVSAHPRTAASDASHDSHQVLGHQGQRLIIALLSGSQIGVTGVKTAQDRYMRCQKNSGSEWEPRFLRQPMIDMHVISHRSTLQTLVGEHAGCKHLQAGVLPFQRATVIVSHIGDQIPRTSWTCTSRS